ncbi:MAG: indolepyruvate oxidoreductase subunit beta [Candidatus Sumerlaeaceae bacterium]|jgi:indolepyruvate ferredoxin oxidoreductase beta subunit
MVNDIINILIAGLGGQGIIKASDILADAAFRSGFDVKKSEIHGMSQRGGAVSSDVRFGPKVLSPMIPRGEAHFLVLYEPSQREVFWEYLSPQGKLISPDIIPPDALPHPKFLNIALLGVLSVFLPVPEEKWKAAIEANLPPKVLEANLRAFQIGREIALSTAEKAI